MRQQFIDYSKYMTKKEAYEIAPWAYKIVRVFESWVAFESHEDYKTWKNCK